MKCLTFRVSSWRLIFLWLSKLILKKKCCFIGRSFGHYLKKKMSWCDSSNIISFFFFSIFFHKRLFHFFFLYKVNACSLIYGVGCMFLLFLLDGTMPESVLPLTRGMLMMKDQGKKKQITEKCYMGYCFRFYWKKINQ